MKKKNSLLFMFTLLFVGLVSGCNQNDSNVSNDGLILYRGYSTPYMENAFASIVVAVQDGVIVDASIDEYFYGDSMYEPVPNSDGSFGTGSNENMKLVSKLMNDEVYSDQMSELDRTGNLISENYKAIEDFVTGKTIDEIEKDFGHLDEVSVLDLVAGATPLSTKKYIQSIVDAVKDGSIVSEFPAVDDTSKIMLKRGIGAPHGDQAFADIVVAVDDDKILGASIDEFQYFEGEGVPSSHSILGESFTDTKKPLASKAKNDSKYSSMMKEYANATLNLRENYAGIENFVEGKSISDVEKTISESTPGQPVDAVSGATLVDTVGYLQAIIDVAKQ